MKMTLRTARTCPIDLFLRVCDEFGCMLSLQPLEYVGYDT